LAGEICTKWNEVKLKLAYLEVRIGEPDDLNEKLNLLAAEVVKNHD
jgi:hypothetical protein